MDKTCAHYESCGMEFCIMGIDCPEYKKKDKPILFNTAMVKAILEGRKTQTRRIVKLPDNMSGKPVGEAGNNGNPLGFMYPCGIERPPYKIGDTLWVRETWADTWTPDSNDTGFVYMADGKPPIFPYWGNQSLCKSEVWRPSIHMPREAARLFLKVTNVRVERLQDITIDGIGQEGIPLTFPIAKLIDSEHLKKFINLWDSTIDMKNQWMNYSWGANPWVWVIEFERIR